MTEYVKKIEELIFAIKMITKYLGTGNNDYTCLMPPPPDEIHVQLWREYDIWSRNFYLPVPNPNYRYFFYDDQLISLVFAAYFNYRDCHGVSFEESCARDTLLDNANNNGATLAMVRAESGNQLVFAAVSPLNPDLLDPAALYSGKCKFPRSPFFKGDDKDKGNYAQDFLELHQGMWCDHLFKVAANARLEYATIKESAENQAAAHRQMEYAKIQAYYQARYFKPYDN